MKDQSLDDPFGVRQVPGATFLEGLKDDRIEAIGMLNSLEFFRRFHVRFALGPAPDRNGHPICTEVIKQSCGFCPLLQRGSALHMSTSAGEPLQRTSHGEG